ncbi:ThiF family adenylyltransferase [Kitasatospora sp. NPDC004723]|uniref:ThiF family adenylyltransferase n=1 Tax=Kitasatospora sp. NPDC004723 TaxID=3154288 RepID=UPI0033A623ED
MEQIEWWDAARVRGARCVVAGAGALGNEVVKNLVMLGWGEVVVVDFDTVEESNLSRSVFFGQADVGRPKAPALAAAARRLNPDCRVLGLDGDLRLLLGAGLVQRSDVVFGCLDNLGGRVALSQLARQAGRLMIDGGLTTWEGTVQLFGPDTADAPQPCFACGLSSADVEELALRQSCLAYERRALAEGGVPTTPTLTSAVAALMVQEALKHLHRDRHDQQLALGRELRLDMANCRFWNHALPIDPDCVLHREPAAPDAAAGPGAGDSWRKVLEHCRASARLPEGVLQLPARLLLGWECPVCGRSEQVMRAHAADGPPVCPHCDADVIPRFAAHVEGGEPWIDLSPAEMGVPPWTWIELRAEGAVVTFELSGDRGPLPDAAGSDAAGSEAAGSDTPEGGSPW